MLIDKDYFTLEEVLELWQMPRRDAVYLAENGKLRLSVRVFHLRCEVGSFEEDPDCGRFRIPNQYKSICGVLDLEERDVHALFRDGSAAVSSFHAAADEYLEIHEDSEPLLVKETDLLVRHAERRRIEALLFPRHSEAAPVADSFSHSPDYRDISINGLSFTLGPIQAQVVKILHKHPREKSGWCFGKIVLEKAGSNSVRMADVFKSQPHWRKLIESDRRGNYRLCR
jgi:hypothetical protein